MNKTLQNVTLFYCNLYFHYFTSSGMCMSRIKMANPWFHFIIFKTCYNLNIASWILHLRRSIMIIKHFLSYWWALFSRFKEINISDGSYYYFGSQPQMTLEILQFSYLVFLRNKSIMNSSEKLKCIRIQLRDDMSEDELQWGKSIF